MSAWNQASDTLEIGTNPHFAPLARWDFLPLVKSHAPDFKVVAMKPTNWISAQETKAAVNEYEANMKLS